WWFDVPIPDERRQIWEIHLRKLGRDPRQFDLPHLIAESEGYTGAEIEKAAKQALRRAFLDGEREPSASDLAAALREAEPIRTSHAESSASRAGRSKSRASRARSASGGSDMREHCAICFTADGHAIGVYSDNVPWASLGRILAMPRASHV